MQRVMGMPYVHAHRSPSARFTRMWRAYPPRLGDTSFRAAVPSLRGRTGCLVGWLMGRLPVRYLPSRRAAADYVRRGWSTGMPMAIALPSLVEDSPVGGKLTARGLAGTSTRANAGSGPDPTTLPTRERRDSVCERPRAETATRGHAACGRAVDETEGSGSVGIRQGFDH